MAYDFGQFQLGGGQNLQLGNLLGLSPSGIGTQFGLPADEAEEAGFYSIDPSILQAMNPNDPMYQKQITGTQQSFMPALMQSALATGAGGYGAAASGSGVGLGRGSKYMAGQAQQRFQPYLSQMGGVMSGISSDIAGARGMAGNYLSEMMNLYRGLDYQGSGTLPPPPSPMMACLQQGGSWDDGTHQCDWSDTIPDSDDTIGGDQGTWIGNIHNPDYDMDSNAPFPMIWCAAEGKWIATSTAGEHSC